MRYSVSALILVGLLGVSSCSKETSTTVGATSLADLPKITGPVSGTVSSKLGHATVNRRNAVLFSASTGLKLSAWASTTWSSNHSSGMCETGNMTNTLRAMSSMPDKILEYIGVMENPLGLFTNSYDGTYKIKALTQTEEGVKSTFYVRFKIVKDANGNISSFKMHECPETGTQQRIYIGFDLTGTSVTASMKGNMGGGAQKFIAVATGATNSSGKWTDKSVEFKGKFTSQGTTTVYMKLIEWSNLLDFVAWFSGSNFNGKMRAYMQPIGFDQQATAAIGDGSAKLSSTQGGQTYSETKSWNGDTRIDLTDVTTGDYYAKVQAATLPDTETYADSLFAFDSTKEEDWDCTKTGAEAHDLDVAATAAELKKVDDKYGSNPGSWVDCSATWQP